MATFTTNYNLRKPATPDIVDVLADIGASMDIIDTQLFNNANLVKVPVFKIKTVDTSINNSVALTDDPHLQAITLTAGKKYEVELLAFVNVPDVSDMKYKFNFTGVGTVNSEIRSTFISGGTRTEKIEPADTNFFTSTYTLLAGAGESEASGFITAHAIVFCTTTGVLTFQWAQNQSNAAAVIVKKHSILRVIEIVAS